MPILPEPATRTAIVLVNMPFCPVERPSLALGLLKSILAAEGLPSTILYPNMWFLEYVGVADYSIFEHSPNEDALVDWVFAGVAFPDFETDHDAFLAEHFARNLSNGARADVLRERFLKLRERAVEFVDWVVDRILQEAPAIVGCTSTFQQHVASLALLRRLRERAPQIVTLMGGANCETLMGRTTHANYPWVDYVVSGEADTIVGPLCHAILEQGRDIPASELPFGVFGPAHRGSGYPTTKTGDFVPRAVTTDMRGLPLPHFDEYFAELSQSLFADRIVPGIPMEFSRGCWWGERMHCTFCGLNGSSMSYRAKPAERAAEEMAEMAARYGSTRIQAADNILAIDYFDTALPQLADLPQKLNIFFEVKANLKRGEVKKLADAGVRWIQPGIESLDSRILRLMRKGTTAANNVQLLKWARQYGVRLSWSLLWGFPGEDDAWYADMASRLPALGHLQPAGLLRVRYHRYSPHFNDAEKFGLRLTAEAPFRHVYPLGEQDLFDQVYFFEDQADKGGHLAGRDRLQRPGLHAANDVSLDWLRSWLHDEPPTLAMRDEAGVLTVDDTRRHAVAPRHRIAGLARDILLAADEAPPEAATKDRFVRAGAAAAAVDEAIAQLVESKLLLQLDSRLVGLPLQEPVTRLPEPTAFPGGYLDRGLIAARIRQRKQAAADHSRHNRSRSSL